MIVEDNVQPKILERDEVVGYLRKKYKTEIAEIISAFLSPFSPYFVNESTDIKSLSIITDSQFKECFTSIQNDFKDGVPKEITRLLAPTKIKKQYLNKGNFNFIKYTFIEGKPVAQGITLKNIEKMISSSITKHLIYVSRSIINYDSENLVSFDQVDSFIEKGRGEFKLKKNKIFLFSSFINTVFNQLGSYGLSNIWRRDVLFRESVNKILGYSFFDSNLRKEYRYKNITEVVSIVSLYKVPNLVSSLKFTKLLPNLFDKTNPVNCDLIARAITNYSIKMSEELEKRFHVLKGSAITYFYKERNYNEQGVGVLGNSCMRYNYLNPKRFDFYAKNKNISMLVLMNNTSTKIKARALLWEAKDGKTYIDRVYYDREDTLGNFAMYCNNKGYLNIYNRSGNGLIKSAEKQVEVDIEFNGLDEIPYLDSFRGRIENTMTICTSQSSDEVHLNNGLGDLLRERNRDMPSVRVLAPISVRKKPIHFKPITKLFENTTSILDNIKLISATTTGRFYGLKEFEKLRTQELVKINKIDPTLLERYPREIINFFKEIESDLKTGRFEQIKNTISTKIPGTYLTLEDTLDLVLSIFKVDDKELNLKRKLENSPTTNVTCSLLNIKIPGEDAIYMEKFKDFVPKYIDSERKYQVVAYIKTLENIPFYFRKNDYMGPVLSLLAITSGKGREKIQDFTNKTKKHLVEKPLYFYFREGNLHILKGDTSALLILSLEELNINFFEYGINTYYKNGKEKERTFSSNSPNDKFIKTLENRERQKYYSRKPIGWNNSKFFC